MPVRDGTIISLTQRNNSMTAIRPYHLTHTDGRRSIVVATSQAEAIRHAERGWSARPASALDVIGQPIEYARESYKPLPAGTPTREALVMPGEGS